MPYDPVADFVPVARLAVASYAFAVNARSVPAKDMRSLIAYIKANPGKINYATPGNGTPHHLTMEMLKSEFDLDRLHVPYKGISGALTDLMGGQVQLMFGSLTPKYPHLKKSVRSYFLDHFSLTTSGVFSTPEFMCTANVVGFDNLLFSVDYPFESNDLATSWFHSLPIADSDRAKVAYLNAERVLKL